MKHIVELRKEGKILECVKFDSKEAVQKYLVDKKAKIDLANYQVVTPEDVEIFIYAMTDDVTLRSGYWDIPTIGDY
jgi:hypothetical protein